MSDIFFSYASQDRAAAERLAGVLAAEGWSVWWDRTIMPGKNFARMIEDSLNDTRCVVVLWSTVSRDSDWVQNEACHGDERHTLIPALIDDVKPPFEFQHILQFHRERGDSGKRSCKANGHRLVEGLSIHPVADSDGGEIPKDAVESGKGEPAMLFIARFEDDPGKLALRHRHMSAHLDFLRAHEEWILVAGSLREAHDGDPAEGLWIIDADSRVETEALCREDPFWVSGLRKGYSLHHWSKAFPDKAARV